VTVVYLASPERDGAPVRDALGRTGVAITLARDLAEVLQLSADQSFDACIIDLAAGRRSLSSVRLLSAERPDLPIAVLIDEGQAALTEDMLPAGVVEVLPWPFAAADIAVLLANLRDQGAVDVRAPVSDDAERIFEDSPAMQIVMDSLRAGASERSGAGFCGERGSGRRLLARTLHRLGDADPRRPLVELDCALPPGDLDRRLFGGPADRHGDGSGGAAEPLGAESALAAARGGTLLLANLAQMPARLQARLARLLRDREALIASRRREIVDLDVRLMAVLDAHIDEQVREGDVRADLYERLSYLRVDVPPLRRRREDIPALAAHYLRSAPGHAGRPRRFSRSALALLSALPWPGNASELRQLIDSVDQSVRRSVIQIDDLLERASLEGVATRLDVGVSLRDAKARFERECISAVLVRHHGRVGDAAKALGIQRTNLYRKVRQLNVARSLLGARR
jgi:DNA-binding NtrC family response regulator